MSIVAVLAIGQAGDGHRAGGARRGMDAMSIVAVLDTEQRQMAITAEVATRR